MPWASWIIPVAASVIGGAISADGSRHAANVQSDATKYAADKNWDMFLKNIELQEPWRKAGIGSLSQLVDGTKPGGDLMRDFTAADFQKDPGYQFRMDEGMKGVEASAAARGGALSGGALKDLTQYGQGFASNEYSNAYNRFNADRDRRFNRLAGIAGIGQTATNQVTSQGADTARTIGDLMTQGANARASGYIGQGNAANQAIGNIGNWWQYNQNQQPPNYTNPPGSDYNYRGADLPSDLRGGG